MSLSKRAKNVIKVGLLTGAIILYKGDLISSRPLIGKSLDYVLVEREYNSEIPRDTLKDTSPFNNISYNYFSRRDDMSPRGDSQELNVSKEEKKFNPDYTVKVNLKEANKLISLLLEKEGYKEISSSGISGAVKLFTKMEFAYAVAKITEDIKQGKLIDEKIDAFWDNISRLLEDKNMFLAFSTVYANSLPARLAVGLAYNTPGGYKLAKNLLLRKPFRLIDLIKVITQKVPTEEQRYDYEIFKLQVDRPMLSKDEKGYLKGLEEYLSKGSNEGLKDFMKLPDEVKWRILASDYARLLLAHAINDPDGKIRLLRFLSKEGGSELLKGMLSSQYRRHLVATIGYLFNTEAGRSFGKDLVLKEPTLAFKILLAQMEIRKEDYDPSEEFLRRVEKH